MAWERRTWSASGPCARAPWGSSPPGGAASFSAGDLTIRMGERGEAGDLRRRALELLRPYARDEGFCFRGVEGS
ncbi:hypothetical protein [uncultured Intestinimonas sp.]|uniref:hypothetical protein n=1 Tax=uncultured Intestinimonas sp. TaxID=1689265 RepID=UPI0025DC2E48|nr:hypothetical protein [uncultured Intestinimonas sp.]